MNTSESGTHRERSQRPDGDSWRTTLYDIIFEADTPAGWWFDIGLLVAILTSIAVIALETVDTYQQDYSIEFAAAEWVLTGLFTLEYALRLSCARRPLRYALSFWGIIDLLSILPTYLAALALHDAAGSFVMIRSVRLLRVFRVLKLWRMMNDADELSAAIWKSRNKIIVFLAVVLVAITISGTLMYYIETELPRIRDENAGIPHQAGQFTSIPQSMYWATVTMTTVGYGDIVPQTTMGKVISAVLILLGYSLIIVPSGFVTAELTAIHKGESSPEPPCPNCEATDQHPVAVYCYRCGIRLDNA